MAVSSTRMELLARKSQLRLAGQGADLLEQKRTALLEEILRLANVVMVGEDRLAAAAARAHQALARANAAAGAEAVKSSALAARRGLQIRLRSANVMGVRVPVIVHEGPARSRFDRDYSIIGTSLTIDEAAAAFEDEIAIVLNLAETELRLNRLTEEIRSTSRRLNALQNILIPRLQSEIDYIRTTLDDRERSDHYRLKLAKRLIERKRAGDGR